MSLNKDPTTACFFPTTHWSAVAAAAAGDGEAPAAKRALGALLAQYMPAMKTFLVLERRLDRHRADDLLQGFVAERVLEKGLLARADRTRGRFRTFLLACLNHYVYEQLRKDSSAARHPGVGQLLPLGGEGTDLMVEPGADAFDAAWAKEVVAQSLGRMESTCRQMQRPDLWALFQGRVAKPAFEEAPPLDYSQLVEQFHFQNVAQATNALVTAKRLFARLLREVVGEYVEPEEVDEELLRLKQALAVTGDNRPRR